MNTPEAAPPTELKALIAQICGGDKVPDATRANVDETVVETRETFGAYGVSAANQHRSALDQLNKKP